MHRYLLLLVMFFLSINSFALEDAKINLEDIQINTRVSHLAHAD